MSTVLFLSRKVIKVSELEPLFEKKGLSVVLCSEAAAAEKYFLENNISFVFCDYNIQSDCLSFLKKYCVRYPACWVLCMETALSAELQQKLRSVGVSFAIDAPRYVADYLDSYVELIVKYRENKSSELARIRSEYAFVPSENRSNLSAYEWEEDLSGLPLMCPKASEKLSPQRSHWIQQANEKLKNAPEEREALSDNVSSVLELIAQESPDSVISLISIRPEDPLTMSRKYTRVLMSSRGENSGARVPLKALPDSRFAIQEKQSLFLEDLQELSSNPEFQFEKDSSSTLTVPIIQKSIIVGLLRAEFTQALSLSMLEYVQDLCAYSKSFQGCFKRLEFFSRIYSKDSALYR